MPNRKAATRKTKQATDGQDGGIVSLTKELFQAAITLGGSVEPADYRPAVARSVFSVGCAMILRFRVDCWRKR